MIETCPAASGSLYATSLPATFWAAALRGIAGSCPRCGKARLFARFLKPHDWCQACHQDWTMQRADDFPAYIAIFVTGHVLAPLIIAVVSSYEVPSLLLAAIILPLAVLMMIGMIQPAKGAVIALQWWHGMHGFKRERTGSEPDADTNNQPT